MMVVHGCGWLLCQDYGLVGLLRGLLLVPKIDGLLPKKLAPQSKPAALQSQVEVHNKP